MGQQATLALADYDRERLDAHRAALEEAGFSVSTCADGSRLLETCRAGPPDIVVLEVFLPSRNGFEVVKSLKEEAATSAIRIVCLLDEGDGYGAHRARICGADRILERPISPEDVVRAARQVHGEAYLSDPDVAEDDALEAVLETMEGRARAENPLVQHITDPLTGLFNMAYMDLKIAEEFKAARRFSNPLSCVALEIDDGSGWTDPGNAAEFRRIVNEVAGILLCESRDIDHVARSDAGEFVALLPHTDVDGSRCMSERILVSIEGRDFELPNPGNVQASVGIATYTGLELGAGTDLLERARETLARSRRQGKGRMVMWTAESATEASEVPKM